MEVKVGRWVVLMDDEDYQREFRAGRTWRVAAPMGVPYLVWMTSQQGKRTTIRFHRLISGAAPGEIVDHINRNSLDNRKSNLRVVTALENSRNCGPRVGSRSRFKGIGWNSGSWRVRIRVDYRHIEVGRFKNEVEAAYAYDLASLKYHGEYGSRNFLPLA